MALLGVFPNPFPLPFALLRRVGGIVVRWAVGSVGLFAAPLFAFLLAFLLLPGRRAVAVLIAVAGVGLASVLMVPLTFLAVVGAVAFPAWLAFVYVLAGALVEVTPPQFNHVFFTNSGSESVDTALKIALAYQRERGKGTKTRFIGRERGYHGVGFGGISVGGIVNNRRVYGSLLTGVDHLPHTLDMERNRFVKGQPEHGAELADDLERIVELHDGKIID